MTSRIDNPDTDADIQLRACLDARPTCSFVMVAGAGSGKTTSLVKALRHLVQTRSAELRRRGQRIACITYTVVAEQEIARDLAHSPLVHVSTIHSFLWEVIKPFQEDLRRWVIERIQERIAEHETKASAQRTRQATRARAQAEIERLTRVLAQLPTVRQFRYGTGSDYDQGVLGHDDVIRAGPLFIERHRLLCQLIAQRFPFILVDESQDTTPEVVAALKHVARETAGACCIGFFGDPMQKIYATGVGDIAVDTGWTSITKPENFRCPQTVLALINRIRADGDGLEQVSGRTSPNSAGDERIAGTARFFILPADAKRTERLLGLRKWLSETDCDPRWMMDDSELDLRALVIVHRMAALRLGFADLFAALNDRATTSIKEGFRDGTAWVTRVFLSFILPLVDAAESGREFDVITLLRQHCSRLQPENLIGKSVEAVLAELVQAVGNLRTLCAAGSTATVWEVLRYVRDSGLARLDDRWPRYLDDETLNPGAPPIAAEETDDEGDLELAAVAAMLRCPVIQLTGYRRYVDDESPFSTQQGIKGAEFDRVFVVLDDEEGNHNQFSYDRYLGLKPATETESRNLAEGRETVMHRTRRLMYVCCSRARQDLAIVLFAADVQRARSAVEALQMLPSEQIFVLAD
jgi:DNA helicase-2/ATP-dependent DNA helicase PcrA